MIILWLLGTNQIRWFYFSTFRREENPLGFQAFSFSRETIRQETRQPDGGSREAYNLYMGMSGRLHVDPNKA
jgi:hypothetical protein